MLSRIGEMAELQRTEKSSSLPVGKRTVGQMVSKEHGFLSASAGGIAKAATD